MNTSWKDGMEWKRWEEDKQPQTSLTRKRDIHFALSAANRESDSCYFPFGEIINGKRSAHESEQTTSTSSPLCTAAVVDIFILLSFRVKFNHLQTQFNFINVHYWILVFLKKLAECWDGMRFIKWWKIIAKDRNCDHSRWAKGWSWRKIKCWYKKIRQTLNNLGIYSNLIQIIWLF